MKTVKKIKFVLLMVGLVGLFSNTSFAQDAPVPFEVCAGDFYEDYYTYFGVFNAAGDGASTIYVSDNTDIDLTSGIPVLDAVTGMAVNINGLGFNSTDGLAYGQWQATPTAPSPAMLAPGNPNLEYNSEFYQIDATGNAVSLGFIAPPVIPAAASPTEIVGATAVLSIIGTIDNGMYYFPAMSIDHLGPPLVPGMPVIGTTRLDTINYLNPQLYIGVIDLTASPIDPTAVTYTAMSSTDPVCIEYVRRYVTLALLQFQATGTPLFPAAGPHDWAMNPTTGELTSYMFAGILNDPPYDVIVPALPDAILTIALDGTTTCTPAVPADAGIQGPTGMSGIYFDSDGLMYGIEGATGIIYQIDPATGVITDIATYAGPILGDAASGPCYRAAAVPTMGTWGLIILMLSMLSLGVVFVWRKSMRTA